MDSAAAPVLISSRSGFARPVEASSGPSRSLPGMTLEAYFQAQEEMEKMEKKITRPGFGEQMDMGCALVNKTWLIYG